jgi:ketosteroid isomerase-like protein
VNAVQVVVECCEGFARGEVPWHLLDEQIEWEITEMVDQRGTFHGHDGVRDFMRTWLGTWEDYSFQLEDLIPAPDDRVLVLFTERGRGKGSGAQVEIRPAGLWTVRHGKVVHYRGYNDRAQARRDAGLA